MFGPPAQRSSARLDMVPVCWGSPSCILRRIQNELGNWLLNLLLCYCFRFVSCCRQNRVALPSWNLFDILPQASGALQSHGVIQLDDQMSNLACQNLQGKAVVQPKSYQQYTSRSAELATISRNRRHWCVHSSSRPARTQFPTYHLPILPLILNYNRLFCLFSLFIRR